LPPYRHPRRTLSSSLIRWTLLSVGLAAALHLLRGLPGPWAWLAGVNLATLAAYGRDKRAAAAGRARTPELTLHALGAAGGTPAALLARVAFRHKTRKRSFRLAFWLIAGVQAAAMTFWLLRGGP
jgi:uncharacterized membrane protein YsdA (DUF1294 family)